MHFRNWCICVIENSCTLTNATPKIYLEQKLNEREGTSWFVIKGFITVLQSDSSSKIGSLLTLFFSDGVGMRLGTCWSAMLFTELPST